jgi:tetratricopeptide (TPR) repeat protein
MMTNAYVWWDSAAAAERMARRIIALRPDDPNHWVGVVEPLLRQGRRAEAVAALGRSGMPNLIPFFERFALHRDLIRWSRHEELDRTLAPDLVSASGEIRGTARWFLLLSLRDRGRLREARALALEGRIPGSAERVQGHEPELVLSATMLSTLGRPDSAARLLHAEARRVLDTPGLAPGVRARDATWRLTLAGTAYAQAGDTAMVRRIADSIEVLGLESTFGRDQRLHHYLRGLVLQGAGRHAEAVAAFRRALISLTDGYSEINLALARTLLELGRPAEAVAVLQPAIRGGVDGSNTYTSRTELHEALARAFELAGLRDSAVAHWRAVERAWRGADPEFAERHARARAAVNAAGSRGIPPGDRDRSGSP